MNVDALQAFGSHDEVAPRMPVASAPAGGDFMRQVAQGLQQVNETLLASQSDLQRVALGETANLHQVLVRLEESRISLQLMLQVRNRALEAYQDVMRMQV